MNADYDETGQLTDKGELVLKMAELYYQHITSTDGGFSLGSAVSMGTTMAGSSNNPYQAGYAAMYGDREKIIKTRATVGGGQVTIGNISVPTGQNFGTDSSGQYVSPSQGETISDGVNRLLNRTQETIRNSVTDAIEITIPKNLEEIKETGERVLNGQIINDLKDSAAQGWAQTSAFFGAMYDGVKEMYFGLGEEKEEAGRQAEDEAKQEASRETEDDEPIEDLDEEEPETAKTSENNFEQPGAQITEEQVAKYQQELEELPADKRAMTVGTLSSTFAEITMSARDYSIFSRILVKFLPRTLSWQATTLMEAINICLSSPACTATMQEASPYLGSDATDDLTAGDFDNIFGTNFARKKAETKVEQKTEAGSNRGTPVSSGMPDPDDENHQPSPSGKPEKWTKEKVKAKIKNLSDYEGGDHGGHTEERHVDKGREFVEQRAQEPRIRKGATSFRSYDEGNAIVRDVIEKRADDIADFLNDPSIEVGKRKDFSVEYGESVGYGKKDGMPFKNDLKEATVVLKKTKDGYELFTSYPLYK